MKRIFCAAMSLVLIFSMIGCSAKKQKLKAPVTFYYRNADTTYGKNSNLVLSEERESEGHEEDIEYLISVYLQGPHSGAMAQTFPRGTDLFSIIFQGNTVKLVITNALSQLTGIDYTLACACITLTVLDLTGMEWVEIQTRESYYTDIPPVKMSRDTLVFLDDSSLETTKGAMK